MRRQVQLALQFRRQQIREAASILSDEIERPRPDAVKAQIEKLQSRLAVIARQFDESDPLIDRVFFNAIGPNDAKEKKHLKKTEGRLTNRIRELAAQLRSEVTRLAIQLEDDHATSLWAGLLLVCLALTVSLAITFRAKHMLQPLRVLTEGAKRIGSGDYAGRVSIQSDDELGILAGEFNNMAAAIEEREKRLIRSERMAAAGMLASHITHEIRNPLNSISLNTELLEEEILSGKIGKDTESHALCRSLQREVDRLTEITEEYLQFARLPKPNLEPKPINLVLSDLLGFMAEEFRAKQVEVKTEFNPDLPLVSADEGQLRQAFLNLIRNANDAMEGGGTLRLSTAKYQEGVVVEIADTGSGISPATLAQVFDPFFSTKDGGTGLGLAITHRIIQEHGGKIAVRSEEASGTTFYHCIAYLQGESG